MIRRIQPFLIALPAVLVLVADGTGQEKIARDTDKCQLLADVVFRKVDGKEMKLDLALPKNGKGPFPAVVCLHGGAWRLGSRKEMRGWIEYLAAEGFVAASVSYRLVPDGKWPSGYGVPERVPSGYLAQFRYPFVRRTRTAGEGSTVD